jgi:hypothetical protein
MQGFVDHVAAQYAVEVISYAPGATPSPGFTDSSAPLGEPEHFTGEGAFPGVVSPFNPPYLTTEVVSIGEGGWLTLRLSNFALPQAGSPEIGVFTNAGLSDNDFPNGQAGSPPGTFGVDQALVQVSKNGMDWESLGTKTFDVPANGYTDLTDPFSGTPGSSLTDFQQPWIGSLSSFAGLPYSHANNPDILDLLAGSGGGTWLDISGTSLSQVGYIRFSVADDDTSEEMNFELDAVSIARSAMGEATIPEPSALLLAGFAGMLLTARRRNRLVNLE